MADPPISAFEETTTTDAMPTPIFILVCNPPDATENATEILLEIWFYVMILFLLVRCIKH
jgi:hypothetical protein